MNPVQYIIVDREVGRRMSKGKFGAQTAHASNEGLWAQAEAAGKSNPRDLSIVNRWLRGGHYAKVVLMADNLPTAERYVNDRGFSTALIVDEGRTEFGAELTPTCFGTGVVDKDSGHVRDTFGQFKLYEDGPPELTLSDLAWDVRRRLDAGADPKALLTTLGLKTARARMPRRVRAN